MYEELNLYGCNSTKDEINEIKLLQDSYICEMIFEQ